MANGNGKVLQRRKDKKVVTSHAQLGGLGILAPKEDQQGNKVQIQPTVVARPNALQHKAMAQGNLGQSPMRAPLADMAIQGNASDSNQTGSGIPASNAYQMAAKKKKKQQQTGFGGGV